MVLLTVSTENNIICSFCHEKWGNAILDLSLISICLTGFGEKAFTTKIETYKVLISSENEHLVPSWEDFIKIENKEDLKTLKGSVEKKIKSFALLPPFFTGALLDLKNHETSNYLFCFVKLIQLGIKNAEKENDIEQLERMKTCHNIFVFLWATNDKKLKSEIIHSKSRSLTSKIFTNWADSLHKKFLISALDEIDCQEILSQFSSSENSSDEIHDIEKFERDEKSLKSLARNIDKELINVDEEPAVKIPEKISPSSELNLETVFKNLGSILQNR